MPLKSLKTLFSCFLYYKDRENGLMLPSENCGLVRVLYNMFRLSNLIYTPLYNNIQHLHPHHSPEALNVFFVLQLKETYIYLYVPILA